jgi:hypothetical protein
MADVNKIKQLVKSTNQVQFLRYFDGALWYAVVEPDLNSDDGWSANLFEFPVPIADIGNATFYAHDKATFFMRYIRQHLDMLETARKES